MLGCNDSCGGSDTQLTLRTIQAATGSVDSYLSVSDKIQYKVTADPTSGQRHTNEGAG
jgi:hypothetical protein